MFKEWALDLVIMMKAWFSSFGDSKFPEERYWNMI